MEKIDKLFLISELQISCTIFEIVFQGRKLLQFYKGNLPIFTGKCNVFTEKFDDFSSKTGIFYCKNHKFSCKNKENIRDSKIIFIER